MPTKGRPMIGARVSQQLFNEMMRVIDESVTRAAGEPWTISTFVERAIAEKLAKMERSRGRKAKRPLSRFERGDD